MQNFWVIYVLLDMVHSFLREAEYKLHFHDVEELEIILMTDLPTTK